MRFVIVLLLPLLGCQSVPAVSNGIETCADKTQSLPPLPETLFPFFWDTEGRLFVRGEVLAERLCAARVVMVGEIHTSFGCHRLQLWVLKTLMALGRKPIVVVEWFQRPYQKVLDDYIAGRIGEDEMLKATEYKERWGFNWQLYKGIVRYCVENGLRIVAANVPKELSKAVARGGLKKVPDNLKRWLPKHIDTNNKEHRKYVLARFEPMIRRGILSGERIRSFYEAQVVWDEAFAESVAEASKVAKKDEVVVLFVGSGHIAHKTAVPDRFKKRTGIEPLVLVPMSAETPLFKVLETTTETADFLFFTRR